MRTYSQHKSGVYAVEWLDQDTVASSGIFDRTLKIWSIVSGQTKKTINIPNPLFCLKFLNNKIHLAAGFSNGDINIYNVNDWNIVSNLKGHTWDVYELVQLNIETLASSSADQTVRIWNLTTNTCKFILTGHTNYIRGLKQITSSILASGSDDATIKLWDTTSGKLIITLTGHTSSIEWSLDLINSQTLVSGSRDQTIKLWNWATGECLATIQSNSEIRSLAFINFLKGKKINTFFKFD